MGDNSHTAESRESGQGGNSNQWKHGEQRGRQQGKQQHGIDSGLIYSEGRRTAYNNNI